MLMSQKKKKWMNYVRIVDSSIGLHSSIITLQSQADSLAVLGSN